jgi:hypothetical protein
MEAHCIKRGMRRGVQGAMREARCVGRGVWGALSEL